MLIKTITSNSHVFGPSSADGLLRRVALVTVGALLLAPVASRVDLATKAALRELFAPYQQVACMQTSPGAANLLGAMEGQPPIPEHGVRVAEPLMQGACPAAG